MPSTITKAQAQTAAYRAAVHQVARRMLAARPRLVPTFREFLAWWHCIDREGGGDFVLGEDLWESQEQITVLADGGVCRMAIIKAGKLGITEIAAAYDAYRGIYGPPWARVHLFSQTMEDAAGLLEMVRYGVALLPARFGRIASQSRGGDTHRSLRFLTSLGDLRTWHAYAAREHVSIAQSAIHAHVDELAHMQFGAGLWNGVITTIPDGGTLWALSRGAGAEDQMATLWSSLVPEGVEYQDAHAVALARVAGGDRTAMVPVFQPYSMRPGRTPEWRAQQAATMTAPGLAHYAPETPDDALMGDADAVFVDIGAYDALEVAPPLGEGERTPLVLAADAGIRSDHFAIVGVTRDPARPELAMPRIASEWVPPVDFDEVRAWVRALAQQHNVVQVTYDPYQLEDMAQSFADSIWWAPFDQGKKRAIADKALRDAIIQRRTRRLDHDALRQHIANAGIKTSRDDGALRIVKRSPTKKVDLAVAFSMALYACTNDLNL